MTIICIANQKGGVGKTTTAVTLATGLAATNAPTVLIDADSQGSAGNFLGLEPRPDIYRLIGQERPISECVQRVDNFPALAIVTGNATTWEIEDSLSRGRVLTAATAFRDALARFGPKPIIIIDTAPSLSNIQVSALNAADWLIIPATPEYAAEAGVASLIESVTALREAGGRINLLGILPTMVDNRTREHRDTIAHWQEKFPKMVLPPIYRRIAYGEAPGEGIPIWTYRPEAAQDYARVLTILLQRLGLRSKQVTK